MSEEKKIEAVIATQSKMLGSSPSSLYIREDTLDIGHHSIQRSDITNIQMIEDDRTDYRSIGVILMNTIIGIGLAYTITTFIPYFMLLIGLSSLSGYAVVKATRKKPYGYVSLETEGSEFRFGVADPISAAQLFGSIYQNLDQDLTHEDFIKSEQIVDEE